VQKSQSTHVIQLSRISNISAVSPKTLGFRPGMVLAPRAVMQHMNPRLDSINERALDFVCQVIDPFVRSIPDRPGMRRIQDQLVGASGGIGSNLEEAQAASSRREFIRYCEIALRESREANFWLRVCQRTGLGDQAVCGSLLGEGLQIARIVASIVINSKTNDSAQ
jgi:four helix bundle protein